MFSKIATILLLAFNASIAIAADPPARCYTFTSRNVPYMEARPTPQTERWCYQNLAGAEGGLFIYNADFEKVRPELAMVKRANGTLTHGSLFAGKVTMHSLRYDSFNPFPVPLVEPTHLFASAAPVTGEFESSARGVLALLLLSESPNPTTLTITPGTLTAETAAQPWRGYWWPNKGLPMVGPLSKYDTFVAARRSNPGSASWESIHHVSHGIWWEGHCNGWAAAAIMRAEPSSPVRDTQTGITFGVSDQKGILTEEDYCAHVSMFGHRYDGPGIDTTDIDPALFHKTLLYYVGSLHKPLAVDYHADAVVDTHVISGYTMNIVDNGNGSMTVTATLRMHQYDGSRVERPGIAPSYTRVYRYILRQSGGRILSGGWLSENPDFMWAPLGPGKCSAGNPNLSEDMISAIMH